MRTAFIKELIAQARLHPDIFLLVGDLGFSVVETFAQEFPDRYLNAGVAEQNMTGVAAGLASEGYHVFTYSIANFPTLRCLEQIRNDICYHKLPVTVVAVGAGMAYGNLGYSHHAVQDIAVIRTLPGITVLSPADPGETCECVQWLAEHPGPSYLRVGKAGEPSLHAVRGLDRGPLLIRNGTSRTALVATGGVLKVALEAHDQLEADGESVPVYSLPWLKPVSRAFFSCLDGFQSIIAIEEHVAEGGVAGVLRENVSHQVEIRCVCVPEPTAHQVGAQQSLRRLSGLTVQDIVSRFGQKVS